jgi:nicotinate-nucleotide adenylyltransferase
LVYDFSEVKGEKMRIAVYGGSFNPPHVSHAMVASWLLWTDQVDEVWMVPVYRHAFEGMQEKKLVAYEQRVSWCRMLRDDVDVRIRVSTIESELPTPSYSIDTLSALRDRHPNDEFRLVIGADVLPDLPKWKDWKRIEADFSPIIVGRGGYSCPPGAVSFPSVSSSEIRFALKEGKIPTHLLFHSLAEDFVRSNPYAH